MGETSTENVYNFYSDKLRVSFNNETNQKVKNDKKEKKDEEPKDEVKIGKSKVIAILLALFLGRYGIHKFYLGRPAIGLVYLIFSRFQFTRFLSICDVFIYIFMSNERFMKEYGYVSRKEKDKKKTKKIGS